MQQTHVALEAAALCEGKAIMALLLGFGRGLHVSTASSMNSSGFAGELHCHGAGLHLRPAMKRKPPITQREELFSALRARFDKHMSRHPGLEWANVQARLEASPDKLAALQAMEDTGGEPDVVVWGEETSGYLFVDCSEQTPKGRVSACYDHEGLKSRKELLPEITAVEMAAERGIELLTEERYEDLQKLGDFDS